ncbi:hypothetical protein M2323_004538 [Rhodoblastus acidophilus]|uniref:hypothetical protein n=1 Tax=Rhodoblastus acidophilus TaxID=1074 RepID=UPI00222443CF|nr:hypothetical protein [Rhodoblastus acidophilus]MCW2286764.1 hypothetical protein [Rhodoblastus acidophilus]MCW2335588.1 hypothetical protein [Rhodoblastus acidophilus]
MNELRREIEQAVDLAIGVREIVIRQATVVNAMRSAGHAAVISAEDALNTFVHTLEHLQSHERLLRAELEDMEDPALPATRI